jgi:hypothetical protein
MDIIPPSREHRYPLWSEIKRDESAEPTLRAVLPVTIQYRQLPSCSSTYKNVIRLQSPTYLYLENGHLNSKDLPARHRRSLGVAFDILQD